MEKRRILIIDDEQTFTRSLKLYLEHAGNYQVQTQNLGSQGVDAAKSFKPDLILLDMIMPDMDGTEVAAQLRDDPELCRIPVVFLTAAVSREEVGARSGILSGHEQIFVAKPISGKEVIALIERR